MINEVNKAIKANFKGNIELGGIGQFLPTDGIERLCYLPDEKSDAVAFVPDDRFVLQACHLVLDGKKTGKFDDYLHTVDLVVIGKTQLLPQVMRVLTKLKDIEVLRYNMNTAAVLRNYVRLQKNDNPELRAFVIQYSFVDKLNPYSCFETWKMW
mgnify:CR=1 FL=1